MKDARMLPPEKDNGIKKPAFADRMGKRRADAPDGRQEKVKK